MENGQGTLMQYTTTIDGHEYLIKIIDDETIVVDGKELTIDLTAIPGQPILSLLIDGKGYNAKITPDRGKWHVQLRGNRYTSIVEDEMEKHLRTLAIGRETASEEITLKAPMPGLVVDVPVELGAIVDKGEVLVILESMKMQNELKAPRAGTITQVNVESGDNVEHHEVLISLL